MRTLTRFTLQCLNFPNVLIERFLVSCSLGFACMVSIETLESRAVLYALQTCYESMPDPIKQCPRSNLQAYVFIESFAGSGAATTAVRTAYPGSGTAAFDIKYSQSMDVNSGSGMALLAYIVNCCGMGSQILPLIRVYNNIYMYIM